MLNKLKRIGYGEIDPNQTWDFTESMFDMESKLDRKEVESG